MQDQRLAEELAACNHKHTAELSEVHVYMYNYTPLHTNVHCMWCDRLRQNRLL